MQTIMSTATTSFTSNQFKTLHLATRDRSLSSVHNICVTWIPTQSNKSKRRRHAYSSSANPGSKHNIRMDLNATNGVLPIPSEFHFPQWSNWMLLAAVPLILPIFTGNWGPLLELKTKIGASIDRFQNIAETIEDVAERVNNITDEVSENLPEGSRFKQIVETIDDVAEETIRGADRAEELLQKVEDVHDKVEALINEDAKNRAKTTTKKVGEEEQYVNDTDKPISNNKD